MKEKSCRGVFHLTMVSVAKTFADKRNVGMEALIVIIFRE